MHSSGQTVPQRTATSPVSGPDEVELVVLLTEDGTPCGTAPKAQVHHADTPLHLAFSCWIVDGAGRTLLTQRAAVKKTWPLAWTNSFCGHPAPGESPEEAVHRRALDELGLTLTAVRPAVPDFRYRAVMPDGTVENEICPVFTARPATDLVPNPDEVADFRWLTPQQLRAEVTADPSPFSPWLLEQLPRMPL